ncbi:MAG TPA: response regulator [Bryobacteraceae bacterium]|nr:response regulator [Bryobacteraceae bacterium]
MSDASTMLRSAVAPVAAERNTPARRKRVVVFDQILRDAELPRALQSAGFEVTPKRVLADVRSAEDAPDLILAEIGELTEEDRRAVESVRAAHEGVVVIGIGTAVMVALSKGRRRAHNSPERRKGAERRHLMDDFVTAPLDVGSLVYLLQAWELAAEIRERGATRSAVNVSSVQALASMGGSKLLEELVTPSTAAVQESLANIRQALVNRDPVALRNAAHYLQSTSGVFGATRMTEIAVLLEDMGRAGFQDGAGVLADSLEEEVARFTKDLRALARSMASASDKPVNGAVVRPVLNLRSLAPAFRGRRIAAFGFDGLITERLETLVRSVDASFAIVSAENCCDGSWADWHDLLILSLGQEDVPEIDGVRQVFESKRAPIVVHLRDSGKELLELATLADDTVAMPGDANEVMLAAHRVLANLETIPAARKANGRGTPWVPGGNGAKAQVLVAEDEPLTGRFLVSSLEAGGFEVTLTSTGADALEAVGKRRFDAAVLDINMPEADGFEVLAHIRQDPLQREMPVMMLSCRSQERDIVKAFDLGADDYVMKPFSPPEVVLRLRKLVGKQ